MKSVTVELAGGIGNQLFQAYAALAIAERAGVQAYGSQHLLAKSSHGTSVFSLDWGGKFLARELDPFTRLAARALGARSRSTGKIASFSDLEVLQPKEIGYVGTPMPRNELLLRGYFQSADYFLHLPDRVFPSFPAPSQELCQALEMSSNPRAVAIHVRRGDYVKHLRSHGFLGRDYYESALRVARDRLGDIEEVWVFSDSEEASNELGLSNDFGRIVSVSQAFRLTDLETLQLMTVFPTLIIGNSSFSFWGGLLNFGKHPKIVLRPSKPFIGMPTPQRYYPTGWIAVDNKGVKNW